jgi:hydrophobic/amphiphilic exporter-1 (mainly G- bacteria), HAE1 family
VKFSLPAFALRRPVTVTMIVITMLGLGALSLTRIPLEFLPRFDFPFIGCWIPYPGATPEQVEQEIAIPAEGEFRTISNMDRITSTSDSDGCFIGMRFKWDADMSNATAEVRDRIERLKLALPDGVDQLYLRRFNANSIPIMAFALFWDKDEEDLAHYARTILQPRLTRIDGVAEVVVFSNPERDVIIEFDQNALKSRGIALYQIITMLQTSNLNVSVGELLDGQTKHFVRVLDEFERPEDYAGLMLGANQVRLKDVANVGYKARDVSRYNSMDGKVGVFVIVRKESEANAVATCRAVVKEVERTMAMPVFEGTERFTFFEQAELIMGSLQGLKNAGMYGGGLALVVLFLFLRRFRPTFLVAFSIPASLVAALVFMFFSGMSLNIVTMVSMIIAIGMLVDNAIVVIENIYRYRSIGLDPKESARRGASEVGLAITAATLTTCVVFIPVFYMETGQMSVYMRQFGGPVIVALLASLLLALTVIPLVASITVEREHIRIVRVLTRVKARLLPRRGSASEKGGLIGTLARLHLIRRIIDVYSRVMEASMRRRSATVFCVLCFVGLTYAVPFRNIQVQQLPQLDTRQVQIEFKFDPNFDLERKTEVMKQVEGVIDQQRQELGIKNVYLSAEQNSAWLNVYLVRSEDMPPGQRIRYTTEQVMDIFSARLPERLPGVELRLKIAEASQDQATRGITVRLKGDDTRLLNEYAERFRILMEQIPNISEAETDTQRARREVQLSVDAPLAERAGISPLVIARTVDFALRGTRLPFMKQRGREIQVWAQFQEEDRQTRANLENVAVMGTEGQLVPLNRLVDLDRSYSPQSIRRVDGKNVVTIEAKTHGDDLGQIRQDLAAVIGTFEMPTGYSVDRGDELNELDLNMANFIMSVILSIILIFVVMSALFESVFLPMSILTSVPLAFMGASWAMYFTNTSFDTIAFIGCILMIGIVVNNGIVIVDHINHLRRKEQMERLPAIVQAGRDRFRPVMMTAMTTILGAVPLAIGGGVGGEVSFVSLGRALIGGLTTGTLLTLFVVPLFYSLIDDFQQWFLKFLGILASLTKRPATVDS